jgi:hypothetical protein
MKIIGTGILFLLLGAPAWAGETRLSSDEGIFNFDLPFEQALNNHVLRSLLNQAIDALEDHIELNGKLRSGDDSGNREGRLELRLYPKGKSHSDEHVAAEGLFRFSPDADNAELNLRFKSSKPSSSSTARDPADFL